MRLIKILFMVGVSILVTSCFVTGVSGNDRLMTVLQIQKKKKSIADRSRVLVSGYLIYETEDHNLLHNSGSDSSPNYKNECIALITDESQSARLERLNRQTVVIDGVYIESWCPKNKVCPYSCSENAIKVLTAGRAG